MKTNEFLGVNSTKAKLKLLWKTFMENFYGKIYWKALKNKQMERSIKLMDRRLQYSKDFNFPQTDIYLYID